MGLYAVQLGLAMRVLQDLARKLKVNLPDGYIIVEEHSREVRKKQNKQNRHLQFIANADFSYILLTNRIISGIITQKCDYCE